MVIWDYAHFHFHGGQSLDLSEEKILNLGKIIWVFKVNFKVEFPSISNYLKWKVAVEQFVQFLHSFTKQTNKQTNERAVYLTDTDLIP